MKTRLVSVLLLFAALLPSVAAAAPIDMKRISERYALTKSRISALLAQRQNPTPFPTNLPNPFYRVPDQPPTDTSLGGGLPVGPGDPVDSTVLPTEADESDAGTLVKFAAKLKVSGVTILNGQLLLSLNQTLSKTGDIIPYEINGHTVYIRVLKITPDELTIGLNQEQLIVRLRK